MTDVENGKIQVGCYYLPCSSNGEMLIVLMEYFGFFIFEYVLHLSL